MWFLLPLIGGREVPVGRWGLYQLLGIGEVLMRGLPGTDGLSGNSSPSSVARNSLKVMLT